MSYEKALALVLQYEGGYVNDPADHGGATNKGVTQAVYDEWCKHNGKATRSVKMISDAEVSAIYKNEYWDAGCCGSMPEAVATVHFDACVQHGINRASKMLQLLVGAVQDGNIGPRTLGLINLKNPLQLATMYIAARRQFYNQIVANKPSQAKFLTGWNNRMTLLSNAIK